MNDDTHNYNFHRHILVIHPYHTQDRYRKMQNKFLELHMLVQHLFSNLFLCETNNLCFQSYEKIIDLSTCKVGVEHQQ